MDARISSRINLLMDFRQILLASSMGVVAITILPWFIPAFGRLVDRVAESGSALKSFSVIKAPGQVAKAVVSRRTGMRLSSEELVQVWELKWVLLVHAGITAIFAVGVMASYYAAWLFPSHRLSLASFSGAINGVATIVMTLVLEPYIALSTDRVLKGEAEYPQLKALVVAMIFSKFLGSLLAQVILVPSAHFIIQVFKLLIY